MRHRFAGCVRARSHRVIGAAWLLALGVLAPRWEAASAAATKHAAGVAEEKTAAAAYRPNVELQTQTGQTVRFYDDLVAGRVVLINFMFTTCTNICPAMTANLAQVQRLLKDDLRKRVVMISISVDPETDTPAVLKAYVERYAVGPGWYFLTGPRDRIEALVSKLGDNSGDKLRHSGMLLIGNEPARTWIKGVAMAPPEEIASAVRKMLEPSAAPAAAAPPRPAPLPPTKRQ